MRIRSIQVTQRRNLAELSLEVPPDAHFICLVGENGTGKSSLLELVTFAAHHMGLSTQMAIRRPMPATHPGSDAHVLVTLATEREDLRGELVARVGEVGQ